MYKIVRVYFNSNMTYTMKTGLTLEEAQAWCRNPETSSRTATGQAAKLRTQMCGHWFDGYEECCHNDNEVA